VLPPAAVAQLNVTQPANLSPSQWKEIGDILTKMPSAFYNLLNLRNCADERKQLMLGLGDKVFARFNELSPSAKDDWRALADIKLGRFDKPSLYFDSDASTLQQAFLTRTLTVGEVNSIIDARPAYQEWRNTIARSSAIIDRLRPVFISMKLTAGQAYGDNLKMMQNSLQEFGRSGSQGAGVSSYDPPELPPLNLTADQVVKQLSQPPLSSGNTSSERAGNSNGPATPVSAQPGVLGPQINR